MGSNSTKKIDYEKIVSEIKKEMSHLSLRMGRVVQEHKDRYIIQAQNDQITGELLGNLRYSASSRLSLPAVGDWVLFQEFDGSSGIIHHVLPRQTILKRKAVGGKDDFQIIAANIDYALIVQAVGRDFSLNRIERYLTICHDSGIVPIVVLNKIDLASEVELSEFKKLIQDRFRGVQTLYTSTHEPGGLDSLKAVMESKATYCMLGSSGVGKSSLINALSGSELFGTREISESVQRGKHTTTHREIVQLPNGSFMIDNPGIREVGITDSKKGLELTFHPIQMLAEDCKFKDCSHQAEVGCAVLAAIESGALDPELYENYMKLNREQERFTTSLHERRKKEKQFGKMIKQTMQEKKKWKR
ncbi:MAG: ribosome small subunit-dependent GTPase A [Bacteroidetes bacterium]|nr:MAG: ribosome small subunit-dependent GTPase A [Bacteroidota bacterium]